MSYRLEYQWAAFHIPVRSLGFGADRYIVAIEGGDNNVRHARTGKRARSWDACMIGTAEQVLKQAVYFAGACEGGSLQPHGRCCTPEAYIRRIRRLINNPAGMRNGWWSAKPRVGAAHAIADDAGLLGFEATIERRYGQEETAIAFAQERHPEFFALVDKYCGELPAWCFAEVGGLPAS